MTTFVGTQKDFLEAIESVIQLDYAASAAYEEAMQSLKNEEYKKVLSGFKEDHDRHIKDCSQFLREEGKEPPTGAGAKQLLTQGKVMFAELIGDRTILKALKSNEEDTNTAYERLDSHPSKREQVAEIITHALEDEQRHRRWLLEAIDGAHSETKS